MAKKTPMQMKKAGPVNDKKTKKPKSAMERYADQRNKSMQLASTPSMMQHDPEGDVYHLQKASEINGDESRKRAARMHAAKRIKMLNKIMK